ncbi:ferredoxin reductase family protein [Albimonas pacifica]|uniref:Predicted ferric reductase n=1 Tax=Albimonas pacifica TaxID=1114924 RepID=A0A1I3DV56_9RHOB|nr:ferric reductase-like transmembrane domain-containing protein [Albimonas pacifica]SFH90616.1 Predicted ferric reductase [Albimonas pacifica]
MSRNGIRVFWGVWAGLALLWLATNLGGLDLRFFALRASVLQLTGVLGMGAMSLAMILALRPRWPEGPLGGLDKMYRLHRRLGIGGLAVSVFHWSWAQGPKWAVGWGWLERPHRGPRPPVGDPLHAALAGLRHEAEAAGEWAFYALAALVLVALVRRIPYRWFRLSHRLTAAAYLALVFHSVALFDFGQWATPQGAVLALLMLGGSGAALVSLTGRIGAGRQVAGTLVGMRFHPGVHALEKRVRLGEGWPGHRAGQFAFVASEPRDGAHPYTIASAWDPATREIVFLAKELGRHTTGLEARLRIGQPVTVEGPYGRFIFDEDPAARQIWVGGGIGIAPFVARMKELAARAPGQARPVDLFHCTREVDEGALALLAADAAAAGVRLHVLVEGRDGLLTGERLRAAVPDWREAGLWFCGPTRFGAALRADLAARGFPVETRFHQELFELR